MGGNSDKSGTVDATELIKTIKDEFKMTIDIEVKKPIIEIIIIRMTFINFFFFIAVDYGNRWGQIRKD